MKTKQIKMRQIILGLNGDEPIYKEKEITIDESYFTKLYEVWSGKEILDKIDNIIKVSLPNNFEIALEILNDGFHNKLDDKNYKSLLTTPSFMKHQSGEFIDDIEIENKCDYFFIVEEDKDFKYILEDVASLGKLPTKYYIEGEEEKKYQEAINKDIVSRLGLLTSSGNLVNLEGIKWAILPEMTYSFIGNYLEFAENEKGEMYTDKLILIPNKNMSIRHTAMDGSGFMNNKVSMIIQKQLKLNHKVDYAGFRTLGNAGKGLFIRFDWKDYLKEQFGLDSLIVKDFWGNDVDLFKVDIIANASQIKWAKWFKSAEEMEQLKANYPKYKQLLDGIFVVRHNKEAADKEVYLNYQILANLGITPRQYYNLMMPTLKSYKSIIERDRDIVSLALGDWSRKGTNKKLSPTTKTHELLQLTSTLNKEDSIINSGLGNGIIESLVEKKIHELCGGRIRVAGAYKTIIKDVFSYFDSLVAPEYIINDKGSIEYINGYMSNTGLQDRQNYCNKEYGRHILARSPLNSATEILRTELVHNELYEKYFGDNFTSDVLFYPFTDMMMLQSGADEDLDLSLCSNNEILYNAVIEDKKDGILFNFHNQFDGKTMKSLLTPQNINREILKQSGNTIGTYANLGAVISFTILQRLPFKELDDGTVINAIHKNDSGEYIPNKEFLDEDYIEKFNLNYERYKKYSFYLLYLQMKSIDSVKTGKSVTKEEESPISWLKKKWTVIDSEDEYGNIIESHRERIIKPPVYMFHAKWNKNNRQDYTLFDSYATKSVMNWVAVKINSKYGKKARKSIQPNSDGFFKLITRKIDKNLINDKCTKNIEKLYTKYIQEENKIGYKKLTYEDKIIEKAALEYKVDIVADEIIKEYSKDAILLGLKKAKYNNNRISTRFIVKHFYGIIKAHLLTLCDGFTFMYELDDEGEIEYCSAKYIKVKKECEIKDNITALERAKRDEKLGIVIQLRSKYIQEGLTKGIVKGTQVEVCGKEIYLDDILIGKLFEDKVVDDGLYLVQETNFNKNSYGLYVI